MFATPALRASGGMPNFFRRSLDEFKRQAQIAVKMEGLHTPRKVFPIVHFDSEPSLQKVKVLCDDRMLGGFSKASLSFVNGGAHREHRQGVMGQMVTGSPRMRYSKGQSPQNYHRVDQMYNGVGLLRGGRGIEDTHYLGSCSTTSTPMHTSPCASNPTAGNTSSNIQTESIVPTDIHQHLLPCNTPGEWETVTIPFSAFVRTNYGMVVEPQKEMLRQKVRSVGIGLTDRVPGPFELRIADVYATNTEEAKAGKD